MQELIPVFVSQPARDSVVNSLVGRLPLLSAGSAVMHNITAVSPIPNYTAMDGGGMCV